MDKQPIVIIADDVEMNRTMLESALSDFCTVFCVSGGQEVLRLLDEKPDADLVMLDVHMPGMNGFETLAAIRAQLRYAQLPVMLCTVSGEEDSEIRALDEGATDFFVKPFNVRVIRHRVRNLLEKRRMERRLQTRAQNEQMRQLLDSVQAAVGLFEFLGDDMHALYINPAMYQMNGYLPDEYASYPDRLTEELPQSVAEEICALVRKHIQTGEPIEMRYEYRPKRGKPQIRLMRALPMRYGASEHPVLMAIITDITRQSSAEAALHETSQRLQALLDSVPGGIVTFEFRGPSVRMTYFNDTLCNALGYTRQEFAQRFADNPALLLHPSDVPLVLAANTDFLRTGRPMACRYRVFHKSGAVCWMHFSGTLIGHKDDRVLLNGVMIDVTNEIKGEMATKQALTELRYRTEHDALTGLHNRETFQERAHAHLVAHADEGNVVLVLDILRFKIFNDLFGKEAGDKALVAVARSLSLSVRDCGECGRLEADHFAACLPMNRLDTDAIEQAACAELKRQGVDYRLDFSFGLYRVHNLSVSINRMCDRAIMAMKTIKGNVIRHCAVYDDTIRQRMLEEQAILEEMHGALEREEFVIYLQPVYSATHRQPTGAEALVRWQHPKRGMIAPGAFIPLFEQNGFITQLDSYVWDRACRLLKRQVEAGHVLPLSVNISRVDLYKPNLCEELNALVDKYGLDKSLLKLEITETAYADNPQEMLTVCQRLHDEGFTILMDDFGSGYSSLNVLKDLPVDVLKMDMSFVRELDASPRAPTILSSVVRMAKWLRLAVVAEGVETEAQAAFLRSVGCDTLQGYFFARPMSVADYERLLEQQDAALPELAAMIYGEDTNAWMYQHEILPVLGELAGGVGLYDMVDDRLELRRGSERLYALLGVSPERIAAHHDDLTNQLMPEDRPRFRQLLADSEAMGRVATAILTLNWPRDAQRQLLFRCRFISRAGNDAEYCISVDALGHAKA